MAGVIVMRNILAHGYFDIDVVWRVIERDVPELVRLVEGILGTLQ